MRLFFSFLLIWLCGSVRGQQSLSSVRLSGENLAGKPFFTETLVFPTQTGSTPNYRIPAVIQSANGDLLLFAEKRLCSIGDVGYKTIIMSRSKDLGNTWLPEVTLFDSGYEANSYPTTIVDSATHTIWLFFLRDLKEFYVMKSTDDGHNWSKPVSIHKQVTKPEWDQLENSVFSVGGSSFASCDAPARKAKNEDWENRWLQRYGVGAGNAGICVAEGPLKGRLIVPARHMELIDGKRQHVAYCFYSDDNGRSWQTGVNVMTDHANEAQLEQLANGDIMMNARVQVSNGFPGKRFRMISVSKDGGTTWQKPYLDSGLAEPTCHGSLKRYRAATPGISQQLLLFSNPDNPYRTKEHPYGRINMTIKLSSDNGQSWTARKIIYPFNASYSDIVIMKDGSIGVVYERAKDPHTDHYWDELAFARFNLEWITEGTTK